METEPIFEKMNLEMTKSIDHVLHEFSTLHTGKANASMVENVLVDVYGSSMKMRDVAAITNSMHEQSKFSHGINQLLHP